MQRSRLVLAVSISALAGCTSAPVAAVQAARPAVPDRPVTALAPGSIELGDQDLAKMRQLVPSQLSQADARRLLIQVDPAKIRTPGQRRTQLHTYGHGRSFYPFLYGGYSWLSWAGGYWPWGVQGWGGWGRWGGGGWF